jgi:mRNA-degrading endonuclease RelE of RelBE toxin-antitoxin system
MAYAVVFSRAVRAQIQGLPGHIKSVAKARMVQLSTNPRPSHSRELAGHPGHYRMWLDGRYRLVWRVFDDDHVIEVEYVGPKTPDLYAWLGLERPDSGP